MKTLDQVRSIEAHTLNHTAKVRNNFVLQDSILSRRMDFASSVPDFRRLDKGNIRHRLNDIIMLMILARASRCVGRAEIIEFGRHNLNKFRRMGLLTNGVPSEATLCRLEHGIDNLFLADKRREFAEVFHKELLKADCDKEIICVDGKAERGTVLENGRNPDIVSAYSFNTVIILTTEACNEKSNEIKAVPLLIDKIDISGKVVTTDAMSMQKDIIDRIRAKGGDFLIELKANQRSLRYGVENRLREHIPQYSHTEGPELSHGRIETRTYNIYDGIDIIADKEKWGGSLTIIEYEADTFKKSSGTHTSEKRAKTYKIHKFSPVCYSIIYWSLIKYGF